MPTLLRDGVVVNTHSKKVLSLTPPSGKAFLGGACMFSLLSVGTPASSHGPQTYS